MPVDGHPNIRSGLDRARFDRLRLRFSSELDVHSTMSSFDSEVASWRYPSNPESTLLVNEALGPDGPDPVGVLLILL